MKKFENLMKSALGLGVSDIHIAGGHPVVYRINGLLKFQPAFQWSHEEVDALVEKPFWTTDKSFSLKSAFPSIVLSVFCRHGYGSIFFILPGD